MVAQPIEVIAAATPNRQVVLIGFLHDAEKADSGHEPHARPFLMRGNVKANKSPSRARGSSQAERPATLKRPLVRGPRMNPRQPIQQFRVRRIQPAA